MPSFTIPVSLLPSMFRSSVRKPLLPRGSMITEILWETYADGAGIHGFSLSEGTFTKIDVPGAILTDVWGINNRGDIVGRYTDNQLVVHSFLGIPARD